MKKQLIMLLRTAFALCILLVGCQVFCELSDAQSIENRQVFNQQEEVQVEINRNVPDATTATELIVRFGDNEQSFVMHLEDNHIAVPSRYEIPDNSGRMTQAGDVFYSDPNRIV